MVDSFSIKVWSDYQTKWKILELRHLYLLSLLFGFSLTFLSMIFWVAVDV